MNNERFLVLDPGAGGTLRTILRFRDDSSNWQRIHVLKRLHQPSCLPQILDFECRGQKAYIVLSWIEGIDMENYFERIRRQKVQPPEPFEAIRLIRELVHGLRSLHEHAQIMHGDLKPSNLILSRKPSHLHMVDFGSAWPIEKTMKRMKGDGISPAYSAPELQNRRDEPLCHVDQFSVSVILHQLLTQNLPYSDLGGKAGRGEFRDSMQNTFVPPSRATAQPNRLSRRHWRLIDKLVQRGLEFDPSKRFPRTSAWLSEIEMIFLKLKLTRVKHQPSKTILRACWNWLRSNLIPRKDP